MSRVRAAVVGAGAWGTALAILLDRNGHEVRLWSYEEEVVRSIREGRMNRAYLPGVEIPGSVELSDRLEDTLPGAQIVVSVSPAQFVGRLMAKAAEHIEPSAVVVSASKGIEIDTLRRMEEVLAEALEPFDPERLVVLSGPSFAVEVAKRQPTAVVAAGRSPDASLRVQEVFGSPDFRVYTNDDVVGVELCGALKNVIALAAGVCAGLDFGHNAQAALITRGLAEITRLGLAMGAERSTFYGLAGIGDLVLTCTGELSRNRSVGYRLGRGERLDDILADMRSVAEGVRTASAAHELARRHGVEMPIVDQIHAVLQEGKRPRDAVQELMLRDPRAEADPDRIETDRRS